MGGKKPTDLGLFDLYGNVFPWCQESYQNYPAPKDDNAIEDKEDALSIAPTTDRVVRGGSLYYRASNVRSANRNWTVQTERNTDIGFRPARTITP